MISCVIFDLDDTLCDYRGAVESAKKKMNAALKEAGIDVQFFWEKYHAIEPVLFRQFVENKISKADYRFHRYADVLTELNHFQAHLPATLNAVYMQEANGNVQLFDDVIPFVEQLKKRGINIAILTNGPSDGQRDKLDALGLTMCIQHIYISEEIGYAKPKIEAFRYVLEDLRLSASEVIMIGDSLEYDVKGAERAGIKGILLDRENRYPDYTGIRIARLIGANEVLSILV